MLPKSALVNDPRCIYRRGAPGSTPTPHPHLRTRISTTCQKYPAHTMAWRNYFESTNAHYSTTADLCGGVSDGTIWKPANVHVSEVTVNRRTHPFTILWQYTEEGVGWLIVYVTTDAVPSLWHVITDSLGINCNEVRVNTMKV